MPDFLALLVWLAFIAVGYACTPICARAGAKWQHKWFKVPVPSPEELAKAIRLMRMLTLLLALVGIVGYIVTSYRQPV